jgi:imidazole glycerol-phosphate synthase subunit HisH
MSKSVVLVDYGVGNLLSIRRALEAAGVNVIQTSNQQQIASAERIVLPGVGAFGHCMQELNRFGLVKVLQEYSRSGRPMLGICVGMQILVESSEEFGVHEGLGLISGTVKKIPSRSIDGEVQKVPCVGWCPVSRSSLGNYLGTPLEGTSDGTHFYFIHSYSVKTSNKESILAETYYGSGSIIVAIKTGNTFGLQFHPEKSSAAGLDVMRQFLTLKPF